MTTFYQFISDETSLRIFTIRVKCRQVRYGDYTEGYFILLNCILFVAICITETTIEGVRNFHLGGYNLGRSGDAPGGQGTEVPSESRGELPQKLKQFAKFTDFHCRNNQNLKISHSSPLDSCQCV